MQRIVHGLILAALVGGCSANVDTAAPPPAPKVAAKTAQAVAATDMILAELPATVVQPPGARVAVATPIAGLVRSVHVQPGRAVRRGDVLAVIVSRDAMMLAADQARAEARGRLTAAEVARMTELARAGVVAGARVDSARAANAEAQISARSARDMLQQAGAGPDGLVQLRAPIAGRVASMTLEAGASIDGMTAPIIIEAEGSRWLAVQVPERLPAGISPGLVVRTRDGQIGRLETLASVIDPATRSFAGRARLADGGPPLVSGRLVPLTIHAPAPAGAVAVPAAALINENGADQLFVKTATGFALRTVTRAGTGDPAVIVAGLKAGERIAISNLPELRVSVPR